MLRAQRLAPSFATAISRAVAVDARLAGAPRSITTSAFLRLRQPQLQQHKQTATPFRSSAIRFYNTKTEAIKVGEKIPADITVHHIERSEDPNVCMSLAVGKNAKLTTDDLFKGKKAVVVSVPGPYTPCSNTHLPGFIDHIKEIKGLGVDAVYMYAVADHFVMAAWGAEFKADKDILFLGDALGDFAKKTGLTFDLTGFGLGLRSKRFAMVVDDGVVTYLGVEPAGGVTVSGAEAVIDFLKSKK